MAAGASGDRALISARFWRALCRIRDAFFHGVFGLGKLRHMNRSGHPAGAYDHACTYSKPEKPSSSKSRLRRRYHQKSSPALCQTVVNDLCNKKGRDERRKVLLRDRAGMVIEIDSEDEYDWDKGARYEKVWGDRQAPVRERPVDELLLSFRDLFPCMAPLFDSCCSMKRKPARRVRAREAAPDPTAPRLEQVCLDCGNVIDAKTLPRSLAIDIHDRRTPGRHEAFLFGIPDGVDQEGLPGNEKYKGYENWTVHTAQQDRRVPGIIPLPEFDPAPARVLQKRPAVDGSRQIEETAFDMDGTGHVELPNFPVAN